MILAESPDLFTGQLVVGLTALLGLGALALKFQRKPVLEAEFANKTETMNDILRLHDRIDRLHETQTENMKVILDKMEENKSDLLLAGDRRTHMITAKIDEQTQFFNRETRELGERVARIEERTQH